MLGKSIEAPELACAGRLNRPRPSASAVVALSFLNRWTSVHAGVNSSTFPPKIASFVPKLDQNQAKPRKTAKNLWKP